MKKDSIWKLGTLDDFVACYHPENRRQRQESEHFHVDNSTRTITAIEMTGGKRLMYQQPIHPDE